MKIIPIEGCGSGVEKITESTEVSLSISFYRVLTFEPYQKTKNNITYPKNKKHKCCNKQTLKFNTNKNK